MDPEQLKMILETVVKAATDNARRDRNEDNAAIIAAAMEAAQSGQQKSRKPNLPPFDPKNIDTWIRRMTAAFDRLEITSAKLKFSHIDEKINCDSDPIINEFMCGAPTNDRWKQFVDYLRKKHGKTLEQRADAVIAGTERENRTPSQLWAVMMDKAGTVTLDDVHKQQLMKRLPQEVRQHLEGKTTGTTGKEVAALADIYFDQQGKLKNPTNSTHINAVKSAPTQPILKHESSRPSTQPPRSPSRSSESHSSFTTAFESSEDADVNAVRYKQGQKQRFNIDNQQRGRSQSRGRNDYSRGSNNNNNDSRYSNNGGRFGGGSNNNNNRSNNKCYFHNKFGNKAERCEETCMLWSTHSASAKGRASR